jgi:hypothetical protein
MDANYHGQQIEVMNFFLVMLQTTKKKQKRYWTLLLCPER